MGGWNISEMRGWGFWKISEVSGVWENVKGGGLSIAHPPKKNWMASKQVIFLNILMLVYPDMVVSDHSGFSKPVTGCKHGTVCANIHVT